MFFNGLVEGSPFVNFVSLIFIAILFTFVYMEAKHKEFVNQIKNVVRQTDPTAVAILYGSRATGKARKDSDWDIMILVDKPHVSIKDEQVFRNNLYDLGLEANEAISTFVYAKDDWNSRLSFTPLFQVVKQNGIIL